MKIKEGKEGRKLRGNLKKVERKRRFERKEKIVAGKENGVAEEVGSENDLKLKEGRGGKLGGNLKEKVGKVYAEGRSYTGKEMQKKVS